MPRMAVRGGGQARARLEAVSSRAGESQTVPRIGWLTAGSAPGTPLVQWPGGPTTPLLARSVLALDAEQVNEAVSTRCPVVLLFEDGDPSLPLLVGLVRSSTPLLDQVLARSDAPAAAEVRIDGRRRVLEAEDEIVLRCGEASITLRRNGRVVIRGAQVETRARGTNRIKGGSVKIN
jgi:hypothetical protein